MEDTICNIFGVAITTVFMLFILNTVSSCLLDIDLIDCLKRLIVRMLGEKK